MKIESQRTLQQENTKQCKNYRPISVSTTMSSLYGRALRDHIEEEYQAGEDQCGLRAVSLGSFKNRALRIGRNTHFTSIDIKSVWLHSYI